MSEPPEGAGRILCIRLSGLGDVVHALNALALLRAERPRARITWVVEDRFAGVLRGHPHIDELVVVPRGLWGGWARNPVRWPRLLAEARRMGRRLRGGAFDVSLDFQSSLKSAWLVAAARAARRIGFGPPVAREWNRLAQTELVQAPLSGIHRIERDVALLGPLGIASRLLPAALPFDEELAREARRICEGLSRPLVVMHPGSSRFAAFKRWPPERYAALADRLAEAVGAGVLITWGPGEQGLAEEAVGGMRRGGRMAPGLRGLEGLTHVLREADLFVGGDTGPTHIAAALRTPVVALFGPKDPVQTGPFGGRAEVVVAPVDCRPCRKRRCRDRRCMLQIGVQAVFGACCRVLDGGGESRVPHGDRSPGPSL